MAHLFTFTKTEGGCGKTTVARNLAVCFARAGYRTLAIDLDQQGNLSAGLGVDLNQLTTTAHRLLVNEVPDWAADGFLRKLPVDPKVKRHLVSPRTMLVRLDCDVPPFAQVARDLEKRERLFGELRVALRLDAKPNRTSCPPSAPVTGAQAPS